MMVVGRLPFKEHDDSSTLFKILDVKYDIPADVSENCKDLITKLIVRYEMAMMLGRGKNCLGDKELGYIFLFFTAFHSLFITEHNQRT